MDEYNEYEDDNPSTSGYMPISSNFCELYESVINNNLAPATFHEIPQYRPSFVKIEEPEYWAYYARQPKKPTSYVLIQHLIKHRIPTDIEVRVGNLGFYCHKDVLLTYSEYFEEMKDVDIVILPEDEVTIPAFEQVFDWFYEYQPIIKREGIIETYRAAVFLGIDDLADQCMACFNNELLFSEDTAFMLFWEARKYFDLEDLQELMLSRIHRFYLSLVGSAEFMQLTVREIIMLCSMDSIGVNAEIEVFMSIVHWLSYDWEERHHSFIDVIKCVRFTLIPGITLMRMSSEPDCLEVLRVALHPYVLEVVHDIFNCVKRHFSYGETPDEYFVDYGAFQMHTPMERNWVIDKMCIYHHHLECFHVQHVTYSMFLSYLHVINWRLLKNPQEVLFKMKCCLRFTITEETEHSC